jgi:hypothetical protein
MFPPQINVLFERIAKMFDVIDQPGGKFCGFVLPDFSDVDRFDFSEGNHMPSHSSILLNGQASFE